MTVADSSSAHGTDRRHIAHNDTASHPPQLAHHFEDMNQQFEAGKLGMWLFLATELLLFGGLFCAYAVYRRNHPELFQYGSQFLDVRWGATNTVILIISSLTMAMAVSAAQRGQRRLLITLLSLTFLGGVGFMSIKYVEYKHKFEDNLVWGTRFYEPPSHSEQGGNAAAAHVEAQEGAHEDADGEGGSSDAHVEEGKAEPEPAGDADDAEPTRGDANAGEEPAEDDVAAAVAESEDGSGGGVDTSRSLIAPPPSGPSGLAAPGEAHDDHHAAEGHGYPDPRHDPERPANAHIFFGIYFCMTGLHGLHVLAGMAIIAWLIMRSVRGDFSREYFAPVDLGGLYWHLVDLIWIFLFPLLYLIH
jgi:cytochrome c oxidase subunit 3